jgi:DNA-binding IclR family transcriptional regulator
LQFHEVCEQSSLPNATVARLLTVLIDRGYVSKDPAAKRYILTLKSGLLNQPQTSRKEKLTCESREVLNDLSHTTGNTAAVFYFENAYTLVLAKAMHPSAVPMQPVNNCGNLSLNTPWGWIYHRYNQPALQTALPSGENEKHAWEKFLTNQYDLLDKEGYCFDQLEIGLHRLASPIFDSQGQLLACLALGGTPYSMPEASVPTTGSTLHKYAKHLEGKLIQKSQRHNYCPLCHQPIAHQNQ